MFFTRYGFPCGISSGGYPLPSVRVRVGSIRDLGFWRTPAQGAMLRRLYPFFNGFISNSNIGAATAHSMDGIPLEKIRVISNGVDLPPWPSTG